MHTSVFARFAAVLTVMGLLLAMASPVSAGNPEKVAFHEEFDENVCGIDVHTVVDGWTIFQIQDYVIQADDPSTQDDFWIGVTVNHSDVTWTNSAGVTIALAHRENVKDIDLVDNGDGTWTYSYAVVGMPYRLRSGNQVVLMEAGRITFVAVIFLGDLSTQADDEITSFAVTSISGPHPLSESDFAIFCDTFTKFMG